MSSTKKSSKSSSSSKSKDEAKTHKLSLKGSSRLVAEFVRRRTAPNPDFAPMLLSASV